MNSRQEAYEAIKTHEEALEYMRGMMNHIGEPLFSRTLIPSPNTAQDIQFFAGQNEPSLGNIRKDRELPLGHLMVVEEIRFAAQPNVAVIDIQNWLLNGCFRFAPNADARVRDFPLEILGAGGGVAAMQVLVAGDGLTIGQPHQLGAFRLPVPEVIKGGIPFVSQSRHAVAFDPESPLKITCIFVGPRAYESQLAVS